MNIKQFVNDSPGEALQLAIKYAAAADALKTQLKRLLDKKGQDAQITSPNGAVLSVRSKRLKFLNQRKALPILEQAGYQIANLGQFKITQSTIKQALGVGPGNQVLKILKDAGCFSEKKVTFYATKTF